MYLLYKRLGFYKGDWLFRKFFMLPVFTVGLYPGCLSFIYLTCRYTNAHFAIVYTDFPVDLRKIFDTFYDLP